MAITAYASHVVLGMYKPKLYVHYSSPAKRRAAAAKVGEYLVKFTADLGLVPHIDPAHGPIEQAKAWYSTKDHAEVRTLTMASSAEDWHYDGDDTDGADPNCAMVLWTSVMPTELKTPDGKIYQPNPWEIVIFNNMRVLHRRPPGCPKHRWVFRQRCQPLPWLP